LLNEIMISRDHYVKIFESVLGFYWIEIPVLVDERGSIYDGIDALSIPNSETYRHLSASRVLELIAHEIETHYIVQHNTRVFLWDPKIQWAWNLEREEGLAMMMEHMLWHDQVDDFDITSTIPLILLGEIYDWWEFLKILESYYASDESNTKAIELFLRRKRNYPLWKKGVFHKDVSYSRWKFKIRNRIQAWKSFDQLFLAKVSFEDIEKFTIEWSEKLIFPQFIAKKILWKLSTVDPGSITLKVFLMEVSWVVSGLS
jgi:hypothetical protein